MVNTTTAGAADELAGVVAKPIGTLFDVLYHPWPTPLAAAWELAGGTVLGGLDLLLHQAVIQVELMTGCGAGLGPSLLAALRPAEPPRCTSPDSASAPSSACARHRGVGYQGSGIQRYQVCSERPVRYPSAETSTVNEPIPSAATTIPSGTRLHSQP